MHIAVLLVELRSLGVNSGVFEQATVCSVSLLMSHNQSQRSFDV